MKSHSCHNKLSSWTGFSINNSYSFDVSNCCDNFQALRVTSDEKVCVVVVWGTGSELAQGKNVKRT